MEIHPWTSYEIARIRDEERLLRAREASLVREARAAAAGDGDADPQTGWFRWLRRRDVSGEQATVRPRPV
jgi:hypothetical protein